jgi:hypothetical protein
LFARGTSTKCFSRPITLALFFNTIGTGPDAFTTTLLIPVIGTSFRSHATVVTIVVVIPLDEGRDDVCYHLIDIVWIR